MYSCENKAVFDVKWMHNPQYLTLHLCRSVKPLQISEGLRLRSSVVNSPTAPVCHSQRSCSAWIAVSAVCLLLWYTRLHHCSCLLPEDMFVTLSHCALLFWGHSVCIFFFYSVIVRYSIPSSQWPHIAADVLSLVAFCACVDIKINNSRWTPVFLICDSCYWRNVITKSIFWTKYICE